MSERPDYVELFERLRPELKEQILDTAVSLAYEIHSLYTQMTPDERQQLSVGLELLGMRLFESGVTSFFSGEKIMTKVPETLKKLDSPLLHQIGVRFLSVIDKGESEHGSET